jgi:hypothetical protein
MLVLDSGGVTYLARRSRDAAALLQALRAHGYWPPVVPAVVLVECTQGHPARNAQVNRFLKTCEIIEAVPERLARRAARLRTGAHQGSAVDALVVAFAEPDGAVVTSNPDDLQALAAFTDGVAVASV